MATFFKMILAYRFYQKSIPLYSTIVVFHHMNIARVQSFSYLWTFGLSPVLNYDEKCVCEHIFKIFLWLNTLE